MPACKPYVSPEALARASLEAIQQNPHPLGQQLPNPVAAAQQQAAMAAMGRGPMGGAGMRGRDGGPSSLAASATPFVPGSMGPPSGSFRASGEPVRYSAPGAVPLLAGGGGGEYGGAGLPSMASADYGMAGGRPGGYAAHAQHAQQAAAYQQQQRWGQGGYGSVPGGGGMRAPPARAADAVPGSAPADAGMAPAAAARQQREGGGYYPSAPARAPSPTGGHRGFASFAAVQQPPAHGFGPAAPPAAQPFGSYQTVEASQTSLGAPAGSGSAASASAASSRSAEEEGEGELGRAGGPAGGWLGGGAPRSLGARASACWLAGSCAVPPLPLALVAVPGVGCTRPHPAHPSPRPPRPRSRRGRRAALRHQRPRLARRR